MLFRAQPSVSSHVAELELQVGKALLIRGGGKFELTKEGQIVFRYASKIINMAKELEDTIRDMQKAEKCICVGTTLTYSKTLMPSLISSFQNKYPSIKINLDVGGSEDMEQTLLSMQNDVVFIANPRHSSRVHAQFLKKEELILIASKEHELSKKKMITLSTLKDYPLILRSEGSAARRIVLSELNAAKVMPPTLIEAKSMDFICELVSQGQGISIVTETAARSWNKELSIIHFYNPLFLNMYVLTLKSKKHDFWLQKFLHHVSFIS